jgi:hydroxyacylglutathione hydrolase
VANVIIIKALHDNYTYLYEYAPGQSLVVDPCDAAVVLRELDKHNLALTTILATHHHFDHTAGIRELKSKTSCQVLGADSRRIAGLDKQVSDGDIINIGSEQIEVITTPGHTKTSACYYLRPSKGSGLLWTGDTLFGAGCGRLFECTADTMFKSRKRLAALPDDTFIYCGHNYTVENYEFALGIEPDNDHIKKRLLEAKKADNEGNPTVPSTIGDEKKTNVFLRAGSVKAFAELRKRKDFF